MIRYSRQVIKTRSGFSEIRVERRPLPRHEPALAIFSIPIPAALSLADDIAKRLRDRTAFPRDFYQGATE